MISLVPTVLLAKWLSWGGFQKEILDFLDVQYFVFIASIPNKNAAYSNLSLVCFFSNKFLSFSI